MRWIVPELVKSVSLLESELPDDSYGVFHRPRLDCWHEHPPHQLCCEQQEQPRQSGNTATLHSNAKHRVHEVRGVRPVDVLSM